jgi:hypothetical protein
MIVLGASIQSSIWGYGFSSYGRYLGAGTSVNFNLNGGWGAPTLAPNGYLYCLPTTDSIDSVQLQKIAVIQQGTVNSATTNYTKGTISFVTADGSANRPLIPNTNFGGIDAVWRRYVNRGILAPNGLIYFIPESERTILVLNPGTGPSDCSWSLKTYDSIETDTGIIAGSLSKFSFKGAVLGQDGYIYLIPNKACTIRIAPKNTSVNATSTDVYQVGYYNASTPSKIFIPGATALTSTYFYPKDSSGVSLTTTPNIALGGQNNTRNYIGNVATGILHPNGLIYMGGGATRWIFVLDPNNWGTSNEIFSAPNLYLSPSIILSAAYSKDLYLEKPKSLNPSDIQAVKILYLTDTYFFNTSLPYDPLLNSLVINTATNTVSAIGDGNQGSNLGSTGSLNGITLQMPNGLFYKTASATATNGRYLFTGPDVTGIKTKSVVRDGTDTYTPGVNSATFAETMGPYSRSGASTILPGSKSNVSIVVGGESQLAGGFSGEMVSIKQYSPDTTYFNYTLLERSIYQIPTTLSTLPTSLYNSYCNTIK